MVTTHRVAIDEVKRGGEWSALEQELLAACREGRFAVARNDDPPAFSNTPTAEEMVAAFRPKDQSDPDRRVRPALIRYLMEGGCDGADGARPHPKGVMLRGAWIDGVLDMHGCISQLDLALRYCLFEEQPTFRDAELGALYLTGSRVKAGLDLQRLKTETNLHLSDSFHATGTVDLRGAEIGGQLDCTAGRFDGAGGVALEGGGLRVTADMFLSDGFHATGTVDLIRAEIGGQLACDAGRFDGAGGMALNGDTLRVGADVFLRDGFHATGMVDLVRARIEGNLRIIDA